MELKIDEKTLKKNLVYHRLSGSTKEKLFKNYRVERRFGTSEVDMIYDQIHLAKLSFYILTSNLYGRYPMIWTGSSKFSVCSFVL
jgi:hypothetical protein